MNRDTLGWLAASAAFATMVAVAVAVATARQTRAEIAARPDQPVPSPLNGVRVDAELLESARLVSGPSR